VPRLPPHALAVLPGVLLAALQLGRFVDRTRVLDDSFICFRIARNWVEHGAPVFNLAGPPADAATSPIWLGLSALAISAGIDPLPPLRALGGACHLVSVVLVGLAAAGIVTDVEGSTEPESEPSRREPSRRFGKAAVAAAIAALLVAASGSLAFHALSGMESGLFELCCAGIVFLLAQPGSPRVDRVLSATLVLAALTRPEGILLAAVAGVAVLSERGRRAALLVVLPCLVAFALFALVRLSYYGSLLPNAFHAKPPDTREGLADLGQFALYGLGAFGWTAALPAMARSRAALFIAALAVLSVAGTVWSGGDWMPGHRRFTPALLALATLAAAGLVLPARRARLAVGIALASWFGANLAAARERRDSGYYPATAMGSLGALAAKTPNVERVALVDIGQFGWHFPREIYDVAGLTDAHLARVPGGHLKKWDEEYFRAKSPDLVLVHVIAEHSGVNPLDAGFEVRSDAETCMLASVMRSGYRGHNATRIGYDLYLLVFVREPLTLPPFWGPPAAFDWAMLPVPPMCE
jgi:hypothetical protein